MFGVIGGLIVVTVIAVIVILTSGGDGLSASILCTGATIGAETCEAT